MSLEVCRKILESKKYTLVELELFKNVYRYLGKLHEILPCYDHLLMCTDTEEKVLRACCLTAIEAEEFQTEVKIAERLLNGYDNAQNRHLYAFVQWYNSMKFPNNESNYVGLERAKKCLLPDIENPNTLFLYLEILVMEKKYKDAVRMVEKTFSEDPPFWAENIIADSPMHLENIDYAIERSLYLAKKKKTWSAKKRYADLVFMKHKESENDQILHTALDSFDEMVDECSPQISPGILGKLYLMRKANMIQEISCYLEHLLTRYTHDVHYFDYVREYISTISQGQTQELQENFKKYVCEDRPSGFAVRLNLEKLNAAVNWRSNFDKKKAYEEVKRLTLERKNCQFSSHRDRNFEANVYKNELAILSVWHLVRIFSNDRSDIFPLWICISILEDITNQPNCDSYDVGLILMSIYVYLGNFERAKPLFDYFGIKGILCDTIGYIFYDLIDRMGVPFKSIEVLKDESLTHKNSEKVLNQFINKLISQGDYMNVKSSITTKNRLENSKNSAIVNVMYLRSLILWKFSDPGNELAAFLNSLEPRDSLKTDNLDLVDNRSYECIKQLSLDDDMHILTMLFGEKFPLERSPFWFSFYSSLSKILIYMKRATKNMESPEESLQSRILYLKKIGTDIENVNTESLPGDYALMQIYKPLCNFVKFTIDISTQALLGEDVPECIDSVMKYCMSIVQNLISNLNNCEEPKWPTSTGRNENLEVLFELAIYIYVFTSFLHTNLLYCIELKKHKWKSYLKILNKTRTDLSSLLEVVISCVRSQKFTPKVNKYEVEISTFLSACDFEPKIARIVSDMTKEKSGAWSKYILDMERTLVGCLSKIRATSSIPRNYFIS